MTWEKRIAIVLMLLLLTGTIVGCLTKTSTKPAAIKHIRYALSADPESIDPRMSTSLAASAVQAQLFEGLLTLDEKNQPVAAAAERWDISPDGKKYIFYLRNGVKWSNGDPLTAHDFEYAWKSTLDPALASSNAYMLFCLKNGEAYATRKVSAEQVGVRARDAKTLEVELERPTAYFLALTAFHAYYPVHAQTVRSTPQWSNEIKTLIGNGPFRLSQWTKSSRMELVRNEHYWDRAAVRSERLELFMLDNASTALAMFESGQLDIGDSVPPTEIPRLVKTGKVQIQPFLGTYYVSFNVGRSPFQDSRVRRAFSLAIDRQAITDKIMQGGQIPALAFVPPGLKTGSDPQQDFRRQGGDLIRDHDIATARRLLAEAGYPDGRGFPAVTYQYNTSESNKMVAEALQEMWRKNLGVQVRLANQEWKVYWDMLEKHDFQLARESWSGDYPDPMTFLDLFVSGGTNNSPDYRNPVYDQLISQAQNSPQSPERFGWLHQAEKILIEDAVIAPVYFQTNPILLHPGVKGVVRSILGVPYFKTAYLDSL